MRRDLGSATRALAVPTLALLFVAAFVPGRLPLAVRVYALAACAVALGLGVVALRRAYPPASPLRKQARAQARSRSAPPTLARREHEAALGVAGAFDLHYRLVPRLRDLTSGLLWSRRGISLDADPETARLVLDDDVWALVRPDRRPPEDRQARGIPPDALARVVESLERV